MDGQPRHSPTNLGIHSKLLVPILCSPIKVCEKHMYWREFRTLLQIVTGTVGELHCGHIMNLIRIAYI